MKADLKDAPEALRVSVKEVLEGELQAHLVFIEQYTSTLGQDKSCIRTTWRAYLECGNWFLTYYVTDCPDEPWNQPEKVWKDEVSASEILTFIEHSGMMQDLIKRRWKSSVYVKGE